MNLRTLLNYDAVIIDSTIKDKSEILRRISEVALSCLPLSDDLNADTITNALASREEMGSTGFGDGVAIPHCRLDGISEFCVGFFLAPSGIPFDSIDGDDVHFLPFVVGPSDRPREHLSVLSSLVQLLRIPGIKKKLLECRTKDDLAETLNEHISPASDEPPTKTMSMKQITVFIQDESLFDEILQIFAAVETVYAMVIEAHESTDYLRNMSIFAGFWNMDIQQFNRIIVAVVREELVNSTVRNIEYICGDLSCRDDILLTVSNLQRVLGSLSH